MKDGDDPIVQPMDAGAFSRIYRKCPGCENEDKDQVNRKEAGGNTAPPVVSGILSSGGGQPMNSGTKQFMETRFGRDFSAVRIHTGSRAAESAAAIQARAYTNGLNIVFGAGEYQPESERGKRLLAHELVAC